MEFSIHPIRMGFGTVYAIKGEGVILIDGGDPNKLANFKDGLAKALIQPEEIKLIILTVNRQQGLLPKYFRKQNKIRCMTLAMFFAASANKTVIKALLVTS